MPLNEVNGPSDTRTCSPISNTIEGFGRLANEESRRLDTHLHIGDLRLHDLEVRDRMTEGVAVDCVLACLV